MAEPEAKVQASIEPRPHQGFARFSTPLIVAAVLAIIVISANNTEFNLLSLIAGRDRFLAILSSLVRPDLAILPEVWERALQTLQISIVSVSLGAVLAFPVSFLAAKNLTKGSALGTAVYYVARTIVNVIRSIPDLFWALVFVAAVGLGPFPGVLALTMFAFGMLGKLFSEAIESIDPGPLEAITATGASGTQVIVFAVIPQIVPAFVAHFLYAWEIAVRVATVVGLVGAGGLGFLLLSYMRTFQYSAAATVILVTVVMVMLIDFASGRIRQRIL